MSVRVISAPQPLVMLADAKQHLLVDHNDDDALIEGFIMAASQWIDGPNGWLKRAIGAQTLELTANDFLCISGRCGIIALPFQPLIDIVAITYSDENGDDVAMATDTYRQTETGVRPVGTGWPQVNAMPEGIRIRYRAGFATLSDGVQPELEQDTPAPIRVAVLMLVAGWYRTREPVAIGATVESLPFAVEALLSPYRVYL